MRRALVHAGRSKRLVVWKSGRTGSGARAFARHGVPTFASLERALRAYARATGR